MNSLLPDDAFCRECDSFIGNRWRCEHCGWLRPRRDDVLQTPVWRAELARRVERGPCLALAGGMIVVATTDGCLRAVDPSTHDCAWADAYAPETRITGIAAGQGALVATVSDTRDLVGRDMALRLIDPAGGPYWDFPVRAARLSAPAAQDGAAYFVAGMAREPALFAVDLRRCALRGRQPVFAPQAHPPVPVGDLVITGVGTARLDAWDAATLAHRWEHVADSLTLFAAALGDDRLVYTTADRAMVWLNTDTARVVWSTRAAGGFTSPPAVFNATMRIATLERPGEHPAIGTYRGEGGQVRLQHSLRIPAPVKTPLCPHEEMVITADQTGALMIADSVTGALLSCRGGDDGEILALLATDDIVYATYRAGAVAAFAGRPALALTGAAHPDAAPPLRAVSLATQGRYAEAAQALEDAGAWGRAAAMRRLANDVDGEARALEAQGEIADALALRRALGQRAEVARLLERLGQWEDAAALWEECGELRKAADAYRRTTRADKALALYQKLGARAETAELLREMPADERKAVQLEQENDPAAAAAVWESLGKLSEAANAWERAGEFVRAVALYRQAENWFKLAEVSRRAGDYRAQGEALEQLAGSKQADYLDAAEAYARAANELPGAPDQPSHARGELHDHAARCYARAFDPERSAEHERLKLWCWQWPRLRVELNVSKEFQVGEWNQIAVTVGNIGYGPAEDILIEFAGALELNRAWRLDGIRASDRREDRLSVACPEQVGGKPNVGKSPLTIIVSYTHRGAAERVRLEQDYCVPVAARGHTAGSVQEKIVVVYGDYYRDSAAKEKHEYQGATQIGDRFVVSRTYGSPGHHCPSPSCGFDLRNYPQATFCPACGRRLDLNET